MRLWLGLLEAACGPVDLGWQIADAIHRVTSRLVVNRLQMRNWSAHVSSSSKARNRIGTGYCEKIDRRGRRIREFPVRR